MAEEGKKDEKEKKEGEAAAEENPEQDAKKRKKKLLIMAIIGVLLIGASGAGAFMFLSGGDKSKAAGEQEITAKGTADNVDEHSEGKKDETKKDEGSAAAQDEGAGKATDASGDKTEGDKGAKDDKKADGTSVDTKGAKPHLDIDFGDTFKMAGFNINLGNALENRYVRLEISLEYKGGDAAKQEIEKRMPQLRDAIIGILQRKTREFLLAPDGKEALRKEILTRINRYMKTKIEAVYITDMLIE